MNWCRWHSPTTGEFIEVAIANWSEWDLNPRPLNSVEYHMHQIIPLHSRDYLKKLSIKINVATDEGNTRNEIGHWASDKIGVAVQSWLWVRVELIVWWLSWLERLNGIQWSWVQIPLMPNFYSYFKVILQCLISYISDYFATLTWLPSENFN